VRAAIADARVEVSLINPPPKIPNASPPDTALYKALGEALRRRAPGAVVAPDILVGFTDNWVFRNCGLHGYGFSPFILEESEWRRVHGNDERISLENLREGVRCHTEMLLDMAAA
jgi:acetylornithine deacetylase/succinyl-diaminopimelate desuccinylase-like protein